jgi:hypothetical protein
MQRPKYPIFCHVGAPAGRFAQQSCPFVHALSHAFSAEPGLEPLPLVLGVSAEPELEPLPLVLGVSAEAELESLTLVLEAAFGWYEKGAIMSVIKLSSDLCVARPSNLGQPLNTLVVPSRPPFSTSLTASNVYPAAVVAHELNMDRTFLILSAPCSP